ncbi:MAG: hypothetical protein ACREOO_30335 [bacterium]
MGKLKPENFRQAPGISIDQLEPTRFHFLFDGRDKWGQERTGFSAKDPKGKGASVHLSSGMWFQMIAVRVWQALAFDACSTHLAGRSRRCGLIQSRIQTQLEKSPFNSHCNSQAGKLPPAFMANIFPRRCIRNPNLD